MMLHRKLTFRERLLLPIIKHKIKKGLEADVAVSDAKMDGMAIAGFVIGLCSLFIAGVILGPLSIIFSLISLKRIKRDSATRKGKGLAIAGLILGIVGTVGGAIVLAIALAG